MVKRSLSNRVFFTVLFALGIILLLSRIGLHYFADDFYFEMQARKMRKSTELVSEFLETTNNGPMIGQFLQKQAGIIGGVIVVTDKNDNILYSSFALIDQQKGMRFNRLGQIRAALSSAQRLFYTENVADSFRWVNYKHEDERHNVIAGVSLLAVDHTIKAIGSMNNYILGVSLLVAVLASLLAARNISRPLIELNRVAKDLSDLDFSSRSKIKRTDEIGQLGDTINSMAERLQQTIGRLRQELKKERDSEKVRRAFVARASHELQTPLAVISGYTEALQDKVADDTDEQQHYYDIIKNETNKLSSMVRDLLELSRLENPEFSIEKKDFDIIVLLRELVEKQLLIGEERNIAVKTAGLATSYKVNGDALRIEQAISNIISNAKYHTPDQGQINVSAVRNGKALTISIENSGSKIPKANLPHIWNSFYTTNQEGGAAHGTGLGLSITKNILLRHDCIYGAENTATGVRFWFTIEIIN